MMSLSGSYATAEYGVFPLEDIAVGLSRIPRFGGQTVLSWSVADHLLACLRFVDEWDAIPRIRLHVGLHDAHEAMTNDVPTHFKTKDLKIVQRAIDERLYASLGVPTPNDVESHVVHTVDTELLLAEASLVAPTATYEKIQEEHGGRAATHVARRSVGWVLQQQFGAPETAAEWLRQIEEFIHANS